MVFDPPEGFILDTASGLYYTQIIAEDADGKISQVVTWFDAGTGEYRREIYPVDAQKDQVPAGKEPVKKTKILIAAVASVLIIGLAVTAAAIGLRAGRPVADPSENAVVIKDKTIGESAGTGDGAGGGSEPGALELTDSNGDEAQDSQPQIQDQSQPRSQAEEISETDTAMDASDSDEGYGMANCYGVDEDELLKANITVSEITRGNSYCNGEMTDYFTIVEAGEYGITQLFYHTEPLNNDWDIKEYDLSLTPLGARFSTLYDQDCIETKARGGGLEITFYVFINGSTEVDAQSVVVDESEHSKYERFSFGAEYPGDYYQFDL
ncbi:MAG: hypothetical protein K5770_10800 [Lachnospiraceae bacterium]|nr:hypothetical protein [Lachnospiraceae bacterium]